MITSVQYLSRCPRRRKHIDQYHVPYPNFAPYAWLVFFIFPSLSYMISMHPKSINSFVNSVLVRKDQNKSHLGFLLGQLNASRNSFEFATVP